MPSGQILLAGELQAFVLGSYWPLPHSGAVRHAILLASKLLPTGQLVLPGARQLRLAAILVAPSVQRGVSRHCIPVSVLPLGQLGVAATLQTPAVSVNPLGQFDGAWQPFVVRE